jgi:hypothetical protein
VFIGAINSTLQKFLAEVAGQFDGRDLVVGCSGNFTSEAVLSGFGKPSAIHSNDVSIYSCMLGRWMAGESVDYEITDPDLAWVEDHFGNDTYKLASLMVLFNMLQWYKRDNAHRVRMWALHQSSFSDLVLETTERLVAGRVPLTSFYAGDVWDHFQRFADNERAVFCCYAPTYAGGYESLYKTLDAVTTWDEPTYPMLDDDRRDSLISWMQERRFLWYDDRQLDDLPQILEQDRGQMRTVYLYSNFVTTPAVIRDMRRRPLPALPVLGEDDEIGEDAKINLAPIKTTDLALFKDAYLAKNIEHAQGGWAFLVVAGERVIGFLEFSRGQWNRGRVYMFSDFPVGGTRYKRLSKLMPMLAISGETCGLLERVMQERLHDLSTTAFTDKPVSMKYRGVLKLAKRGETEVGQKFLNYYGKFNDLTWNQTLEQWLQKHGSKQHSTN